MIKTLFLSLLPFFILSYNYAQNRPVSYSRWGHPVLMQMDKKANVIPFGRKKGGDFVNMAAIDKSARELYWITAFGEIFDSVSLSEKEYTDILNNKISPFDYFDTLANIYLDFIEDAKSQLRQDGKITRNTDYINAVLHSPEIKNASSTLKKILAIDNVKEKIVLRQWQFNNNNPKHFPDSTLYRFTPGTKPGTIVKRNDSVIYYNQNELLTVYKALVKPAKSQVVFYNHNEDIIDSIPLNPEKVALLATQKIDVFLLYRGWLEWQRQMADSSIILLNAAIKSKQQDSVSGNSFYYAGYNNSPAELLTAAIAERKLIEDKINLLSSLDTKYVSTKLHELYKEMDDERFWILDGFAIIYANTRGNKQYFLTDHRGNVMETVSDRKIQKDANNDGIIDYYEADVISAQDYSSFGAPLDGRAFNNGQMRYGYNGKETDKETGYEDYGMRIYDPRIGQFLSVDPLTKGYPSWSPYPFAMNNPIEGVDLDGQEYLSSKDARIEVTGGVVMLKLANMHNVTRNNFELANENPDNWSDGSDGKKGIGISTTVGSLNIQSYNKADADYNATDNTPGAPDPNFKAGETTIEKPIAKSTGAPDRRYKDRTVSSATAGGPKAFTIASLVVDVIIVGSNYLGDYLVNDDIKRVKSQEGILNKAVYDVNRALTDGKIDSKFKTPEMISDIINVVFSGVSNLKNKEIEELGKKIYKDYSKRRFKYDGTIKIAGPSGQLIMNQPAPNPIYDPNYGKEGEKKPAATGTGG